MNESNEITNQQKKEEEKNKLYKVKKVLMSGKK